MENALVAAVTAVPATIAAVGAWRNSRSANAAVNHKGPGDSSISEQVTEMHESLGELKADVRDLKADVHGVKADVRELKSRS